MSAVAYEGPFADVDGDAALETAVAEYYAAMGFAPERLASWPTVILGRRALPSGGEDLEATVLAPRITVDEAMAALQLAHRAGVDPGRRYAIVVRSRMGLNNEDRAQINAAGGLLVTPMQFFDAPFRDISDRLRARIDAELLARRAPQPFRRLMLDASDAEDALGLGRGPLQTGDLLDQLTAELAGFPPRPTLTVICGPAGVGKTVALNALLARLHDDVNHAKSRIETYAARPLLFEPEELGAKNVATMNDLIAELQSSALADTIPNAAFDWLHERGFTTWLFDGLDEFYRSQNDFLETLSAKLDAPRGRARVLLCLRDSLLSSSERLRSFLIDRLRRDPEGVSVYEVARWSAPAKRVFVETRLKAKGYAATQIDAQADAFERAIEASPALAELTDLPFYCDAFVEAMLTEEHDLRDEFALLQYALDQLIAREAAKLEFSWDAFVSDEERRFAERLASEAATRGLVGPGVNPFADALAEYGQQNLEWMLGAAAFIYRFGDPSAGGEVMASEMRDFLAPSFLDASLDPPDEDRMKLLMLQFPVFGRGGARDGSIRFVHELIADYLAAKYALWMIESAPTNPSAWAQALGRRRDVEETVLWRYLVDALSETPEIARAVRPKLADARLGPDRVALIERLIAAAARH